MNDPFSTTYAGAYGATSGIGKVGENVASYIQEQNKRKQTIDMLKQFGIIEDEPITMNDYKKLAKEHGATLNISTDIPEEKQLELAKRLSDQFGLKPKSKGIRINLDNVKNLPAGVSVSGGDVLPGVSITGQPNKIKELEAEFDLKSKMEADKLKKTQEFITALMSGKGLGSTSSDSGIGVTGYDVDPVSGGIKIQFGQTPESKVKEQAKIARVKEGETAIGKASRLGSIGETVKGQWLKTSPYKGKITKTGVVPLLGQLDILKKGIGATEAQRQDQVYSDFVQGIRAQLARGMGDVGNLSAQEQQAVVRLVPNLYDSYESGILKLEQLSKLVEDIKKTRVIDTKNEGEDFSQMSDEELKKIAGMK